ncbi:MAG: Bor family protein [Gemmatimonadales bacterium]|nr:Bor family protein [Gemmatimonadales bacterium]
MRYALAVSVLLLASCYHATIETGAAPSQQSIRKGFASGWIFGLVPPSTVATQEQCSSGVARVETQLSFVNQLVSFLTLGIYTPMQIDVTCAAGGSENVGAAP